MLEGIFYFLHLAMKMLVLKPHMADKLQKKTQAHEMPEKKDLSTEKSLIAQREAEILSFWKENKIFKKTIEKPAPRGEFVFFDGPPFATGTPHYGHLLPGTIKDVIPRFKTMQGYHIPRKWGWDCHGLPIENLIEKELNLKTKKDIEALGIETFNEAARNAVLRYDHVWKDTIPRTGRFIDMDNAYLTMDWRYSESIWWSFKNLYDKGLIYQGFKSMMLCPRCETTLSNFEVTQGYKDITDISVYVKFELLEDAEKALRLGSGHAKTFVLAWTTTPWTLPGNVALAVHPDIEYVKVKVTAGKYEGQIFIVAQERLEKVLSIAGENITGHEIIEVVRGLALVDKKYAPVFDYYVNADLKNKKNAWKIVPADFVTTTDGTGVVHIAPAFGEDDYTLSQRENLPFIQHVGSDGKFKKEVTDFVGQSVKPIDTKEEPQAHQKADIEIIKNLAAKGALFAKEKLVHSYPHCWRCDTPLLNYATSSWFVRVTDIKDKLVSENQKVTWVPQEIGEGRFGKWLENARDWAISRARYWGAPLPVWFCKDCGRIEVMGSVEDIRKKTRRNKYFVVRHGEADHNVQNVLSSDPKNPHHLTDHGREQVTLTAQALKDKQIDVIIMSPLVRTRETEDLIVEQLAFRGEVLADDRLKEFQFGDFNMQNFEKYHAYYNSVHERLTKRLPNGECINDIRKRIGEFLYDIDAQHEGKNIVLVTHDGPASVLFAVAEGADDKRTMELWGLDRDFLSPGQGAWLDFAAMPHNQLYELDLHRPYIDNMTFKCTCRETLHRVPEVFDTWYESGSMPYASIHYPFENKELFDSGKRFPADFIAEGQDQTRGWFYSLLVLSVGLFDKAPFKKVIVNGTILAEDGQKMSKRLKNYPEMDYMLDTYGADAIRYYLMSSPAVKAEDLAFSEKGVDEVVKKLIMRLQNVYTFYKTYESPAKHLDRPHTHNILDQWILARLDEITKDITLSLERLEIDKAARPLAGFIDDLSTWYLRRSRDRFKGENEKDKNSALETTRFVLREVAVLLAPFMPFTADDMYLKVKATTDPESVHLTSWPTVREPVASTLEDMQKTRTIVEMALALRGEAKLKIRQPLASLSINSKKFMLDEAYCALIADEINVKDIILDPSVGTDARPLVLDTTITEALKLEGQAREFIRAVQEARKESGLHPQDIIKLHVQTDDKGQALVTQFESDIKKTVQASSITFAKIEGGTELSVDGMDFVVGLL
jgi:isoleucyl-tRNA synthetase